MALALPLRRLPCWLSFHHRSSALRFRDKDGLYKSQCRRCGVRMVRERRTQRWLVMIEDRDARRRSRPLRRFLRRMTGPIIFLLLLGLALGVTMYLRGPDSFWQ